MRKLKPDVRAEILEAFRDRAHGDDIPPHVVADLCAQHGAALLEIADEHPEWFEPTTPTPPEMLSRTNFL